MALSGLQREVLSLYRALFRATKAQPHLRMHMQSEFRSSLSLRRTEVERIEYLLRRGRKQLEMITMKGVKKVSFTTVH